MTKMNRFEREVASIPGKDVLHLPTSAVQQKLAESGFVKLVVFSLCLYIIFICISNVELHNQNIKGDSLEKLDLDDIIPEEMKKNKDATFILFCKKGIRSRNVATILE